MGNSNWLPIRLGDACNKIGSGATPRGGAASYLSQGPYALVRSQNVYNNGFERNGLAFIGEEQARALQSVELRQGDVLLNITGESVGRSCQVPQSILPARVNQHVSILRTKPEVLDPLFLRYALIAPLMQQTLAGLSAAGATRRALTKSMLESLVICAPQSVKEQRRIADVLGALDNKIELNRRMSETLEEIVHETYKAWFRDVGTDMRQEEVFSRPTSTWHSGRLDELAQEHKRGVRPEEVPPETPYIGLEHMPRHRTTLDTWGHSGDVSSNKSAFRRGEILFGKLRPYFHKVGVAPSDGICSTDIVVVAPKNDEYFGFVLATLSSDDFVQFTDSSSTGTRMPRTSWKSMASYELRIPPVEAAREFNEFVRPMVERNISATFESRTLAELRDTLLPKLISGELRIPDAEKLVSEVT